MAKDREAFTEDLQPFLDEKNANLAARLQMIDEQEAAERARFMSADERIAAEAKKGKK